jgi:hypothetical protein
VAELSASLENLQAYCNTLHEEVHVLYDRLHPNMPPDVTAMGAGPSGTAIGGSDEGIDLFGAPPSMNLADNGLLKQAAEQLRMKKTRVV